MVLPIRTINTSHLNRLHLNGGGGGGIKVPVVRNTGSFIIVTATSF